MKNCLINTAPLPALSSYGKASMGKTPPELIGGVFI